MESDVGRMKKIAILGSTGSIGTQTLEVVRENGDIEVTAAAAGNNITLIEEQIREFVFPSWRSIGRKSGRVKKPGKRPGCPDRIRDGWSFRSGSRPGE